MDGNTLKKISPDGRLEWAQTYNIPYLHALAAADDGGFVIMSMGNNNWPELYETIMKISPSGTVQWEKTFNGLIRAWGGDATQASDGGFLMLTGTTSPEAIDGNGVHDEGRMYLVKLDASGNTQWGSGPERFAGGLYSLKLGRLVSYNSAADGDISGSGFTATTAWTSLRSKSRPEAPSSRRMFITWPWLLGAGGLHPGIDCGFLIAFPAVSSTKPFQLSDIGELQWSRTISELTSFMSMSHRR